MYQLTAEPYTYPVSRREAEAQLFKVLGRIKQFEKPTEVELAQIDLVMPVTADAPIAPEGQRVMQDAAPTLVDGVWTIGWSLISIPEPELGQVNLERERRLAVGSAFTVDGVTDPIPLQGRPFDQTVYLALLTRAGGLKSAGVTTPALTLRDAADTIHELTPDQMISLISQSMLWFESVMATSWAMKDGAAPFETGIPADYTDDAYWP